MNREQVDLGAAQPKNPTGKGDRDAFLFPLSPSEEKNNYSYYNKRSKRLMWQQDKGRGE